MAEDIAMVADRNFRGSYAEGFIRRGDRFSTTPRRARLHETAGRAHRASEEDDWGEAGTKPSGQLADSEQANDTQDPGPSETKPDGPTETKPDESADEEEESGSSDQPAPVRSYEKSGSWKTLYEEGEEVGKVLAPEKEVERWRRHERELDDLK